MSASISYSGANPGVQPGAQLQQQRRVRLLLVEDSLPLRKRLRALIDEDGSLGIVAETGSSVEAIRLFHDHQPDAVLLDWQLVDGDCTSVLLEIKKSRPLTRVLVLTNFDTPEFERACKKLGADQFLSKSRDFVRLPELLKNQPVPDDSGHPSSKNV